MVNLKKGSPFEDIAIFEALTQIIMQIDDCKGIYYPFR